MCINRPKTCLRQAACDKEGHCLCLRNSYHCICGPDGTRRVVNRCITGTKIPSCIDETNALIDKILINFTTYQRPAKQDKQK